MGLKISSYKVNGSEFVDAYAKVDNIRYNNNSKIASFEMAVYPTKGSNNLIEKPINTWAKLESGVDSTAQCYTKLAQIVSNTKSRIEQLESEIANEEDGPEKFRKEMELSKLKTNNLLQLEGEEW